MEATDMQFLGDLSLVILLQLPFCPAPIPASPSMRDGYHADPAAGQMKNGIQLLVFVRARTRPREWSSRMAHPRRRDRVSLSSAEDAVPVPWTTRAPVAVVPGRP